jgi:hypothetical protein
LPATLDKKHTKQDEAAKMMNYVAEHPLQSLAFIMLTD